jgi:hypothetical protein
MNVITDVHSSFQVADWKMSFGFLGISRLCTQNGTVSRIFRPWVQNLTNIRIGSQTVTDCLSAIVGQ